MYIRRKCYSRINAGYGERLYSTNEVGFLGYNYGQKLYTLTGKFGVKDGKYGEFHVSQKDLFKNMKEKAAKDHEFRKLSLKDQRQAALDEMFAKDYKNEEKRLARRDANGAREQRVKEEMKRRAEAAANAGDDKRGFLTRGSDYIKGQWMNGGVGKKAAMVAVPVAALAATAYGAKKLYDRRHRDEDED